MWTPMLCVTLCSLADSDKWSCAVYEVFHITGSSYFFKTIGDWQKFHLAKLNFAYTIWRYVQWYKISAILFEKITFIWSSKKLSI